SGSIVINRIPRFPSTDILISGGLLNGGRFGGLSDDAVEIAPVFATSLSIPFHDKLIAAEIVKATTLGTRNIISTAAIDVRSDLRTNS
ncbi:hypothetical protein OFB61_24670, partial [Escherichia coli]|nr:hypothetical protein [Escherichia coli]